MFFALALMLAGCTPAGPRALLQGKKYLEHGDYADAVTQLKTATTLLATNANVWNYYGVALQRAGQPDEAAGAYKRALELDRDLSEAHFNLGSLWLEQNKPDLAKAEFTAYTLRRNNDAEGWLKLGSAQLKLGEVGTAERSFSAVLALKTNEAEAYNGLGLSRIKSGSPRDAVKFFAAAVQARGDYAPALLNLATVNQQYLHDNKAALNNYRAYLALNPRPANWDEVNALAASLDKSEVKVAAVTAPVEKASPPAVEPKPPVKVAGTAVSHPIYSNPPAPVVRSAAHNPPPTRTTPGTMGPTRTAPVEAVQVGPEAPIVTTPQTNPPAASIPAALMTTAEPQLETPVADEPTPVPAPAPAPPKKTGFWHGLFGGTAKPTPANEKYLGNGLTPLPPGGDTGTEPATKPAPVPTTVEVKPVVVVAPKPPEPPPVFTRYNYFAPRKPALGDHTVGSPAAGAFTKARLFETEEKWTDAVQWYQQAATLDPAWFEAQYNTGVLAHRLRNFALALPHYESALAIQPDSVDARYNFALALKSAGYPADAADELKKILAANPNEVRAHLALANICAQSLRDTEQARQHYQKVLDLDPNSPQASDIRFWLSSNQK